jgi:HK97 family phage portal protein
MSRTITYVPQEVGRPFWSRLRDRFFRRSYWQALPGLSDPELVKYFGQGAQTMSGVHVNERNAFTFSAVFDAVNQISSDVAKLPLNLHKRLPNGGSEHYVDAKLYRLLKIEPNQDMGSMVFRRTITAHALTCHGGYAEIERDALGRPAALLPLTPDRVEPHRERLSNEAGRERYGPLVYKIDGGRTILQPRDILHIQGLGYDGYIGYSTINLARQAIGLALAAERFGAAFFGNGSIFGGVLSATQELDAAQKAEITESIEKLHQSSDKAHKFLVLGAGFKYDRLGVPPDEAQMDDLRNTQVEEVARFFNMPLHKLKNLDRATNNNIEQQDLEYYKGCLLNWITLWEEELNRKLIPPLESRQQFIKHNANAFLRGDILSRYTALGMARDRGVINADEWRELEDMNPQPKDQGKIYLVQGAMVPADRVNDIVDAQNEAKKVKALAPAPPAPPAPPPTPADDEAQRRLQEVERMRMEAEERAKDLERELAVETAKREKTEEELAIQRREVDQARQVAEQINLLAEDIRAEARAATERKAEVETASAAAKEAAIVAGEAQRVADESRRATERIAGELESARGALQAHQAATESQLAELVDRTSAERTEAEKRLAAEFDQHLRDNRQILIADIHRLELELSRAQVAAVDADARLAEARAQTEQAARTAESRDRERVEAIERAEQAEAERVRAVSALEARLVESKTQLDRVEQERTAANTALAGLEARIVDETTARATAETKLHESESAGKDHAAAVLSAHRALVVDIMRRMIERETDRARRAQQSPEKLRAFLESFYEGHEELCRTALLPAVRIHLAWTGSAEDPEHLTRRLVAQHIEESMRQIRVVLDGDADDLAPSLNALLRRWESDRVATIADVLLQKGLDYARAS